jgi:hypothetical protein
VRSLRAQLALAEARRGGPVGIMLHHAIMDRAERDGVAELLAVLAERARAVRMIELADGVPA